MNTLWSFGDSYIQACDYTHKELFDGHWINQVVDHLGYDSKAFGVNGSSLHYTYAKFHEMYKLFKENDVVIVNLASIKSEWFFPDRPHFAAFYGYYGFDAVDEGLRKYWFDNTTPEEREAVKLYEQHLSGNDELLNKVYLHNFLELLNRIALQKNIKIVVLQTNDIVDRNTIDNELHNIYVATGCLTKVSDEEMTGNEISFRDRRTGHLCEQNHTILANKVINHLTNNDPIDLNIGFLKNIGEDV